MNTKNVKSILHSAVEKYTETARDNFMSINDYAIEIGVISADTNRKSKINVKDITNAELMFIHEHGSPVNNIVARPVLGYSLKWLSKTEWPKVYKRIRDGCFTQNWSKEDVKKELENMCIRVQNYARKIIYRSNLLTKNKQSTIERKGSDRPLLDTGMLAKSITCRLIQNKK